MSLLSLMTLAAILALVNQNALAEVLFVTGGRASPGEWTKSSRLVDLEYRDNKDCERIELADFPDERLSAVAWTVNDNEVVVCGGHINANTIDSCHKLDLGVLELKEDEENREKVENVEFTWQLLDITLDRTEATALEVPNFDLTLIVGGHKKVNGAVQLPGTWLLYQGERFVAEFDVDFDFAETPCVALQSVPDKGAKEFSVFVHGQDFDGVEFENVAVTAKFQSQRGEWYITEFDEVDVPEHVAPRRFSVCGVIDVDEGGLPNSYVVETGGYVANGPPVQHLRHADIFDLENQNWPPINDYSKPQNLFIGRSRARSIQLLDSSNTKRTGFKIFSGMAHEWWNATAEEAFDYYFETTLNVGFNEDSSKFEYSVDEDNYMEGAEARILAVRLGAISCKR